MKRDGPVAMLLSLSLLVACGDPIARAEEALEIRDYALAEQILDEAVTSRPRDAEIRQLLLTTFEASGQTDRALATVRVLSNLDSATTNTFRLMRLEAQAGDIAVAKELLDEWPPDSVSALVRREALERGDTTLVYLPYFLRDLGVGDHTAARVLVLLHEHTGDDDYYVTEDIASAVDDLGDVAPELVGRVRKPVEDYLAALPEPTGLVPTLYMMNLTQYDRGVGRLLAAIGDNEKALERFGSLELFARAMYATDKNRALQLMSAMGERIRLYRNLGRVDEARARCRDLQSEYPAPYEEYGPFACIGFR